MRHSEGADTPMQSTISWVFSRGVGLVAAFGLAGYVLAQSADDEAGGLPIWLIHVATKCSPPGTPITDANFSAAIDDWFLNGANSEYGDITQWCTGAVTDMSFAFSGKVNFNENIGNWDVSNVTTMQAMFQLAEKFNQDISTWNTAKVTTMQAMFLAAKAFDQDIGAWNVGRVTNMRSMFLEAFAFDKDIGGWNTSNVVHMGRMFERANYFNQDIGGWNTGKVEDMSQMFRAAFFFNQDLSNWDGSSLQACDAFGEDALDWVYAYNLNLARTPPLSPSMIAAGCGS